MRTGNLFIISGPSGAGKGTLVRELVSRVEDLWVSVSVTTRSPRPGEREGIEYFFISDAEFDELVSGNGLLEWAEVHGNRYGTPTAAVREQVAAGRQVVLEIDPQGAFQVKSLVEGSILIFVMPPESRGASASARRKRQRDGSAGQDPFGDRAARARTCGGV